jgi:hypothetical protein
MKALDQVGEGSLAFFALFRDLEQAAQDAWATFSLNLQRSFLISPLPSPQFPLE